MNDRDFIKGFSKISIADICRKEKVNRSNILKVKNDSEKTKLVRERIESEIAKLYIKEDEK